MSVRLHLNLNKNSIDPLNIDIVLWGRWWLLPLALNDACLPVPPLELHGPVERTHPSPAGGRPDFPQRHRGLHQRLRGPAAVHERGPAARWAQLESDYGIFYIPTCCLCVPHVLLSPAGHEKLMAVTQQQLLFAELRDTFARRLTNHLNNVFVHQVTLMHSRGLLTAFKHSVERLF